MGNWHDASAVAAAGQTEASLFFVSLTTLSFPFYSCVVAPDH